MGGKNERVIREYRVTEDTNVVVAVVEHTDLLSNLRAVLGPTRRVQIPHRIHNGLLRPITIELRDHQRPKVL